MRVLNAWLLVATLAAGLMPAFASPAWMSEEAMRAAFIGKTLHGHYVGGLAWSETYLKEGRLDYRESLRKGKGRWFFHGEVFCTFYDPGYGLSGGCWRTIQASTNCFEFYDAHVSRSEKQDDTAPGPLGAWIARGWRSGEPSTCEDRPSV